eukprot:gene8679-17918_t
MTSFKFVLYSICLVNVNSFLKSFHNRGFQLPIKTISSNLNSANIPELPSIWKIIETKDESFELVHSSTNSIDEKGYPHIKTIIINDPIEQFYYAVCVANDKKISMEKITDYFYNTDEELQISSQQDAEMMTGYKIGNIPPIGFESHRIDTILDRELLQYERIILCTGIVGLYALVNPKILVETGAIQYILDISTSSKSRSITKEINIDNNNNNNNNLISETKIQPPTLSNSPPLPSIICTEGETVHIVGIIARKRTMSKKLTFLNIIPPYDVDEYPNKITALSRFENIKAWKAVTVDKGSESDYDIEREYGHTSASMSDCGSASLSGSVSGSVSSQDEISTVTRDVEVEVEGTVSVAVQLLLGATIIKRIGEECAAEVIRSLKIGQKVYIIGRVQKNPTDSSVMDIVTYSVRVLEEVEVPLVIPEEIRYTDEMAGYFEQQMKKRKKSFQKLSSSSSVSTGSREDNNVSIEAGTGFQTSSSSGGGGGGSSGDYYLRPDYMTLDIPASKVLFVNDEESMQRMVSELLSWCSSSSTTSIDPTVQDYVLQSNTSNANNTNNTNVNTNVNINTTSSPSSPLPLPLPLPSVIPVIGFDCEWQPDGWKDRVAISSGKVNSAGYVRTSNSPVAVLQLSTRSNVYVIDMLYVYDADAHSVDNSKSSSTSTSTSVRTTGDSVKFTEEMNEKNIIESPFEMIIKKIFTSKNIIKVGLGPSSDLRRLAWSYPHIPAFRYIRSVLDIQELAVSAHTGVAKIELEGMSKLCVKQFGRPVDKSCQCSDWAFRPLDASQLQYAAMDAYLLTKLFDSLYFHTRWSMTNMSDQNLRKICRDYLVQFPNRNVLPNELRKPGMLPLKSIKMMCVTEKHFQKMNLRENII